MFLFDQTFALSVAFGPSRTPVPTGTYFITPFSLVFSHRLTSFEPRDYRVVFVNQRQRAGTPAAIASRPRHSERSEAESKSEPAACGRRSNDGQRRLESRAARNDILRDSHACRQACALTGFDYGLRPALRMTQGSNVPPPVLVGFWVKITFSCKPLVF